MKSLSVWLLLCSSLLGQIVGPDEFPRDTAGEYGCQCAYPEEEKDVDLQIEWSSPQAGLNIYPHPQGQTSVYVVGPPGTYELHSDATILVYFTLNYAELGPNFPTDPSDFQRKTERFIKSYDRQSYSRTLRIVGNNPQPDDDDDGDDDDTTNCDSVPSDKWMLGKATCAIAATMTKQALSVAPNYVKAFEDIAGKVERFDLKTLAEVRAENTRQSNAILTKLPEQARLEWSRDFNQSIKDHMQTFVDPGFGDLPLYYRSLANGLRGYK